MKFDDWQIKEDNLDWFQEFNEFLGPEWEMYKRKVERDQAIQELLDENVG